eukprot:2020125-Pyramimonas_sp.AAC.1
MIVCTGRRFFHTRRAALVVRNGPSVMDMLRARDLCSRVTRTPYLYFHGTQRIGRFCAEFIASARLTSASGCDCGTAMQQPPGRWSLGSRFSQAISAGDVFWRCLALHPKSECGVDVLHDVQPLQAKLPLILEDPRIFA